MVTMIGGDNKALEEAARKVNAMTPQELQAEMNSVLQPEVIHDSGYDLTADSRSAPETRIIKIYAKSGGVVIHGVTGDKEQFRDITIDEAIFRCRALCDMLKVPGKYGSDEKENYRLTLMFRKAIQEARNHLALAGFKPGMHIVGK